jgi:hypothetical protein
MCSFPRKDSSKCSTQPPASSPGDSISKTVIPPPPVCLLLSSAAADEAYVAKKERILLIDKTMSHIREKIAELEVPLHLIHPPPLALTSRRPNCSF